MSDSRPPGLALVAAAADADPVTSRSRTQGRPPGQGKPGSCLSRMPLLLDVLADDVQRRTAAGCGEVGRGPEVRAPQVLPDIGWVLLAQPA